MRKPERSDAPVLVDEDGQVTAFAVVMTVNLLLCAGLVLDGGQALAARVRLIGVAQEAARAGAQQLDLTTYRKTGQAMLDPPRAAAAVRGYLAATGRHGRVDVRRGRVHVELTAQVPTQLLSIAGLTRLRVHASGTASPVRGITEPRT